MKSTIYKILVVEAQKAWWWKDQTFDGLPRKLEIIKDGKYSSSKKDSKV